jgi:hypothetical protein
MAFGTRAAHRWAAALLAGEGWLDRRINRESMVTTGADVAQLVEQLTRNEQVVRSSRIVGSISVPEFIEKFHQRTFGQSDEFAPSHLEDLFSA